MMGITTTIFILLMILKLCGVNIPWIGVFSPYIAALLGLIIIAAWLELKDLIERIGSKK